MRLLQTLKISVSVFLCLLFALGTAVLAYPLLSALCKVQAPEIGQTGMPVPTKAAKEPETVRVQLLCAMNEEETEFTAFYVEILNAHAGSVFYFEIPAYTKVTLPQELYRALQAYAPELPQYFRLSKLAGSFSADYRMQGTLQVLGEVLGVQIAHVSCMKEALLAEWLAAVLAEEKGASEFFLQYQSFVMGAWSDGSAIERWMYFDAYCALGTKWEGAVPGVEGVGEFEVNKAMAKEKLTACIQGVIWQER